MSTTAPASAPTWENWSRNIVYTPPAADYYFMPTSLDELKQVLAEAVEKGLTVRVSGQRHSQPPLVTEDNRTGGGPVTEYLIDMSCYADLGDSGTETMVVNPDGKSVTVNTGVREDDVDAFLTANDLMFDTVTAGGFFSLGGMTAVDVHGATIQAPIFAGTVSAFTILGADGNVSTINAQSEKFEGWSPLQFARVSLGGLGIVTSITIDVLPRPYADTLQGSIQKLAIGSKQKFVERYQTLLQNHTRVESFFNPYAKNILSKSTMALIWDVVEDPKDKEKNNADDPATACQLAGEGEFGAPFLTPQIVEEGAEAAARLAQSIDSPFIASAIVVAAFSEIESQVETANDSYSDLWLTKAARVMFMSYFIELPNLDAEGLGKVWDGLDVVSQIVTQDGNFHIAAPLEFRFVKGGDTAMSGTYTQNPDSHFINLDLIGFVEATTSAEYPPELLQFFADVERQWVAMGGFPHNGKMYGFYDPQAGPGTYTPAFNPNFLAELRQRRGERLQVFNAYRESRDPNGVFYNAYLQQLLEG